MKFKPLTQKYKHSSELLVEYIPNYMVRPVSAWILNILHESSLFHSADFGSSASVDTSLTNRLNVLFREHFPNEWKDFINFVFADNDRAVNFISFCLQNFAFQDRAQELEQILADGGSAWAVMSTDPNGESYQRGTYELVSRVPSVVQAASESAIQEEVLLRDAWIACYSRSPDYEKTVSKCVDALEGLFRDRYFPKDLRPAITRFIKDFETSPAKLVYKGNNLVNPKNLLTNIAKDFSSIRGQHTKGTGRIPTKDEAEFVLHYSIFVWNAHR